MLKFYIYSPLCAPEVHGSIPFILQSINSHFWHDKMAYNHSPYNTVLEANLILP